MKKQKKHTFLVGAHISIAGGIDKSIERAESIHCTCMQIFTKSNRQWHAKTLQQDEIDAFKIAAKKSPLVQSIITHAGYLINIGSPNKVINKKSVDSLCIELQRCEQLGIPYLVLHPGSYGDGSIEECFNRIIENLNIILRKTPGKTMILLENTASQGSSVGSTFEQLAIIYKKIIEKKRVGFCFDTCHAFVAGYDFRDEASYKELWKEFDAILGLNKLKAFHFNDSRKELGSFVDRHEHIGKGKLGLDAFSFLCNDKRFFDIPKILETPKDNGLQDDAMNIKTLKGLLMNKTKKILGIE
jgi:deoxyribonuclease-4